MPRNLEVFPAFALEYGGAPKQLKADENLGFFVCVPSLGNQGS